MPRFKNIIFIAPLILGGCDNFLMKKSGAESLDFAYEVCIQKSTNNKEMLLQHSEYFKDRGVISKVSGASYPTSITKAGEPIYYEHGAAPNEIKSISIKYANNIVFIYKIKNGHNLSKEWSTWHSPDVSTRDDNYPKYAMYDTPIKIEENISDAPKIRFRIRTWGENSKDIRKYGEAAKNSNLESCPRNP